VVVGCAGWLVGGHQPSQPPQRPPTPKAPPATKRPPIPSTPGFNVAQRRATAHLHAAPVLPVGALDEGEELPRPVAVADDPPPVCDARVFRLRRWRVVSARALRRQGGARARVWKAKRSTWSLNGGRAWLRWSALLLLQLLPNQPQATLTHNKQPQPQPQDTLSPRPPNPIAPTPTPPPTRTYPRASTPPCASPTRRGSPRGREWLWGCSGPCPQGGTRWGGGPPRWRPGGLKWVWVGWVGLGVMIEGLMGWLKGLGQLQQRAMKQQIWSSRAKDRVCMDDKIIMAFVRKEGSAARGAQYAPSTAAARPACRARQTRGAASRRISQRQSCPGPVGLVWFGWGRSRWAECQRQGLRSSVLV